MTTVGDISVELPVSKTNYCHSLKPACRELLHNGVGPVTRVLGIEQKAVMAVSELMTGIRLEGRKLKGGGGEGWCPAIIKTDKGSGA